MNEKRFENRFNFPQEISQKVMNLLIEIDGYKNYWEAFENISPEYLGNLKKSVIVSSTGSSTRIEGSTLSDEEVEKLMKVSDVKKFSSRDAQEVSGYLELIKLVFSSYETISLSESTIKHFHEISLHYSEKDQRHKGKYKQDSNKVVLVKDGKELGVIFDPTEPHLVQGEMISLVEWTRNALEEKKIHPLLVIGNFIFEYLSIHPFRDGNGRTSRILTNFLLLKSGYDFVPYISHEKIIEENKTEYYACLRASSKHWKTETDENIIDWMLFFLKAISVQGAKAKKITKKEDPEIFMSENQKKIWRSFDEENTWSRKELSEKTGVNIKSVEQIIKKLLEMKKIQKIGMGRATKYQKI